MSAPTGSPTLAARALIAPIRGYQRWISPLLPPSCRFYPSCSQYAVEALQVHGALKGTGYAVLRLLKCAPWHKGGVDMVKPPAKLRTRHRAEPELSPDPLMNHGAS